MWSLLDPTTVGISLHGIGYFRLLRQALGHDPRSAMILLFIVIIIVAVYLHRRH